MGDNRISIVPESAAYLCERFDTHLHPLLRVGRMPGESEDERRQASEDARKQLMQQGLIRTDEVHPFLDDAWHLLAHPPLAVGLAVQSRAGENFNAVLVEQGRSTIQAYQADGQTPEELLDIVLSRHEYGGPAGNAVNLLGRLEPATGGSATLPAELLEEASKRMTTNSSGGMQTALASAGVRQADAQVLAKAFGAPRTLEGVFTVRSYDRKVRRTHKLPVKLQVFVTENGSYMAQKQPGGDGREWFTLAPTDSRKVAAKLEEMVKALAAPARQ
ncbi:ESAT-6 protein secretion system EspG family protein [Halopolyspora algeriensis]|uniref:ESAT-6 protein secretion system EspG family protein n=1 Tax=Halopolyspora algeriensis TaxID=1500506 RepID=A0A368VE30_9ACTN|nr:ESX secretion-associated protein EspG [Halopolyspora algeriensis]RCW38500.1 ESAT-6 protein secretion system EspG family protein [Halopolyspora algeriensis]TQM42581.1 ESAT-6 protein secretion system EspG family protein [Halopolyspora algeriensis]